MQPLVKMCSKGLLACSYKDIEDESKKSARERVRAGQCNGTAEQRTQVQNEVVLFINCLGFQNHLESTLYAF